MEVSKSFSVREVLRVSAHISSELFAERLTQLLLSLDEEIDVLKRAGVLHAP